MENIEHFLNWKKRGYFHYFYSNISLIGTFGNQICNSFTKGSFEFLWTDPLSSNINWFVYIRDFVSLRFETFKLYAFIHIQHLFLYKCANFKFCEKKIFEKESFPREYLRTDILNRNMEIILILVVKKITILDRFCAGIYILTYYLEFRYLSFIWYFKSYMNRNRNKHIYLNVSNIPLRLDILCAGINVILSLELLIGI